jgi:hypothetical protein
VDGQNDGGGTVHPSAACVARPAGAVCETTPPGVATLGISALYAAPGCRESSSHEGDDKPVSETTADHGFDFRRLHFPIITP